MQGTVQVLDKKLIKLEFKKNFFNKVFLKYVGNFSCSCQRYKINNFIDEHLISHKLVVSAL